MKFLANRLVPSTARTLFIACVSWWSLSSIWILTPRLCAAISASATPLPVEGVDRDPDRLALGHVADRVDDPALDLEAVGVHVGVVEEGALVGLPALGLRLLLVSRRRTGRGVADRGRAGGGRHLRARRRRLCRGRVPHKVSTSAIETAQDPGVETLFTDNLSQVNGCMRVGRGHTVYAPVVMSGGPSRAMRRTSASRSATSVVAEARRASFDTVSGRGLGGRSAGTRRLSTSPTTW